MDPRRVAKVLNHASDATERPTGAIPSSLTLVWRALMGQLAKRSTRVMMRQVLALIGVFGAAISVAIPAGSIQNIISLTAFIILGLTALTLLLHRAATSPAIARNHIQSTSTSRSWYWIIGGIGVVSGLAIQTWFRSGTALAGGDLAPPLGTAWIGKLFTSIGWTGSSVGVPMNNEVQLPWAAVSWLTHEAGGSGALAQRIWYTILVAAIAMGAVILARALSFPRVSAAVVGIAYLFNPMTLSLVGINPVFLTAMALVPLLSAAVVSYGTGRIRLWVLATAFIIAAPFVGFAYENPPLVLMIIGTTVLTPLLVTARYGHIAGLRSLIGVVVAGLSLVAASSYWIVPSLSTLSGVSTTGANLSSWMWTETRSTLANGFWLNTTWGWAFPTYFPYASAFSTFPLNGVVALLPIIAFGGLLLYRRIDVSQLHRSDRLNALLALGTLGIILLATGTRLPGRLVFYPLYHLPYGWLLKEPGRFLIVASLGYALMSGHTLTALQRKFYAWHHVTTRAQRALPFAALVMVVTFTALFSSYPFWTGSINQGPHSGFPSTHVTIPRYWTATVNFLNSKLAPGGALLVLPPDDFYQMPYTWYYGNDGFIVNALKRNVLVPSGQGYYSPSGEIITAVNLEAQLLLQHNWSLAARVQSTLGTPLIMVRGDVIAHFTGRPTVPPVQLYQALKIDPLETLLWHDGPLTVFHVAHIYRHIPSNFVTIDTATPNLRMLNFLPRYTSLITASPQHGHRAYFHLSPSATLTLNNGTLSAITSLPTAWRYRFVNHNGAPLVNTSISAVTTSLSPTRKMSFSAPVSSLISTSPNVLGKSWSPVNNCDGTTNVSPPSFIRKTISASKTSKYPVITLSANTGIACTVDKLREIHHTFVLDFAYRSQRGLPARVCVWEEPSNHCLSTPQLQSSRNWKRFESLITPARGTTGILLFLYADSGPNRATTTTQYSNMRALELDPLVEGIPNTSTKTRLKLSDTSFSTDWYLGTPSIHVIVNGMTNGWLIPIHSHDTFAPRNTATMNDTRNALLLTSAILLLLIACSVLLAMRKNWWRPNSDSVTND